MAGRIRGRLDLTARKVDYLSSLVEDDVRETELTLDEQLAARDLLGLIGGMTSPSGSIVLSARQAWYLFETVRDDLQVTRLSRDEKMAARGLYLRLSVMVEQMGMTVDDTLEIGP